MRRAGSSGIAKPGWFSTTTNERSREMWYCEAGVDQQFMSQIPPPRLYRSRRVTVVSSGKQEAAVLEEEEPRASCLSSFGTKIAAFLYRRRVFCVTSDWSLASIGDRLLSCQISRHTKTSSVGRFIFEMTPHGLVTRVISRKPPQHRGGGGLPT